MELVIDANVFVDFFNETVLQQSTSLTTSPIFTFQRLGRHDTAYLDNGGQIKHEWGDPRRVDPEWFARWYQQQLQQDSLQLIPTDTHANVLRAIVQKGFPQTRDRWYVRVAKSVSAIFDEAILVTEDIDFYEPKHKDKGSIRLKTISDSKGSVAKLLRKKPVVEVVCVATYKEWIDE